MNLNYTALIIAGVLILWLTTLFGLFIIYKSKAYQYHADRRKSVRTNANMKNLNPNSNLDTPKTLPKHHNKKTSSTFGVIENKMNSMLNVNEASSLGGGLGGNNSNLRLSTSSPLPKNNNFGFKFDSTLGSSTGIEARKSLLAPTISVPADGSHNKIVASKSLNNSLAYAPPLYSSRRESRSTSPQVFRRSKIDITNHDKGNHPTLTPLRLSCNTVISRRNSHNEQDIKYKTNTQQTPGSVFTPGATIDLSTKGFFNKFNFPSVSDISTGMPSMRLSNDVNSGRNSRSERNSTIVTEPEGLNKDSRTSSLRSMSKRSISNNKLARFLFSSDGKRKDKRRATYHNENQKEKTIESKSSYDIPDLILRVEENSQVNSTSFSQK